jgi:hypothetical protein
MILDLAIDRSGGLLATSLGGFNQVGGNARVRQMIYIAMVEAPSQLILGTQFKNIGLIEERIRSYLESKLGLILPFPIAKVQFLITRGSNEDINVQALLPDIEGNGNDTVPIALSFQGRNGYQAQIDFAFTPNPLALLPIEKAVVEIVELDTQVIRIPLTYQYTGNGPIRIFPVTAKPEVVTEEISFTTRTRVFKYNIIDVLARPDRNIDTVTVTEGIQFVVPKPVIGEKNLRFIPYESGTPFIYVDPATPIGSTISVRITHSNGDSFAEKVDILEDPTDEHVFGMKLDRSKYFAILNGPIGPGVYKALYNANVYYVGDYK